MKKITATQKVILEFYMEIWYCYDYENGSMANPLFTSTSYDLADAEAKDAGYEVVQVIGFEDEEETEAAPTPTSKEGLEDSEIRVYGIDSNLHDGKIFDLTNNDFVHIAEGQGYVWTLAGFESAFNSEEIAYDMFIRFINPVKEQL